MKKAILLSIAVCMFTSNIASADTFGTGENQFEIEFVTISGDASSANGTNISRVSPGSDSYCSFTDPGDFRIGICEITNDQWNKFTSSYGTVTGNPIRAYDENLPWLGSNLPATNISWLEAAQFVNWLNVSTGHQAAYNFTGMQGTSDYTLSVWDAVNAWEGTNLYRHKDAFYFLPSDSEWVKAAYWNGTNLQSYPTVDDLLPVSGVDTNYNDAIGQPWDVGDGSAELNGTFDMIGNVWEWMESPKKVLSYDVWSSRYRGVRGGGYFGIGGDSTFVYTYRNVGSPVTEDIAMGFRVASVPEPATIVFIDIKPGACPNPLNVKSNGVLLVAILGSEVFDVNEIDVASLEILGVRPIRSSVEDVAAPVTEESLPEDCLCTTEGPDGFMDLTLKFDSQEIIGAIGPVEDGEMIILTLTGSLQDGTEIEGTDCVLIRKKGKQ